MAKIDAEKRSPTDRLDLCERVRARFEPSAEGAADERLAVPLTRMFVAGRQNRPANECKMGACRA